MKKLISLGLLTSGMVAIAAMTTPLASASSPVKYYKEYTASSNPSCPYIVWHAAESNGHFNGVAYYSDLSGYSFLTGTIDVNGKIHVELKKTDFGNGPVGTVTGVKRQDGTISIKITGEGCANGTAVIKPSNNLGSLMGGG